MLEELHDDYEIVLDKLIEYHPKAYEYPEQVLAAIIRQNSVNKHDLQRYVIGTNKHKSVLHHLIDLLGEDNKVLIDELSNKYSDKVLDWNQRRILRTFITEQVSRSLLNTGIVNFNTQVIDNFIRDQLPFAHIDTNSIPDYRDYRTKENLPELVKRNLLARELGGDSDHYHDCWVGAEYLKLDNEQKCWHSLLFAISYRAQFANLAIQLWKYPHTENIEDIAEWCGKKYDPITNSFSKMENTMNLDLIIVGKDSKYSKSKIPEFFLSVQKFSEGGNLYKKLYKAANSSEDRNENYRRLDSVIRDSFTGIGRFMSFLAMQQLYAYFSWPINGNICGLEEEGTWSCRIGQVAVMTGLDNATESEIINSAGKNPSQELVSAMEAHTKQTLLDINHDLPFYTDIFVYESVTCEVTDKNLLKSREITMTWTSGEKSEIITNGFNSWKNNYKPTKAYPKCPDLNILFLPQIAKRPRFMLDEWVDNNWFKTMNHLGIPMFHSEMLNDEVDCIKYLPVKSIEECHNKEMRGLVYSLFTKEQMDEIAVKYDPRRYLRWKRTINRNKYYQILNDEEKIFIDSLDSIEQHGLLVHNRV